MPGLWTIQTEVKKSSQRHRWPPCSVAPAWRNKNKQKKLHQLHQLQSVCWCLSRGTKQNNNLEPGFAGCQKSLELLAIDNSQLQGLLGPSSQHFLPIFTAVSGSNMGHLLGWQKKPKARKQMAENSAENQRLLLTRHFQISLLARTSPRRFANASRPGLVRPPLQLFLLHTTYYLSSKRPLLQTCRKCLHGNWRPPNYTFVNWGFTTCKRQSFSS